MATLYENYDSGVDAQTAAYGARWEAMTFTPSVAHTVISIKLRIYRVGSPGEVKVSIRETSGGFPTDTDLVSGTIVGNDLGTSGTYPDSPPDWTEIALGEGTALGASTKYAIVIRATAGNTSNRVQIKYDDTGAYSGGGSYRSTNSGSTWPESWPSSDWAFQERGDELTAPTVSIQAITNIVTTTARGHGNVTAIGDGTITQHGHVCRIGAEPDVDNYDVKTSLGTKAAIGTFVSEFTGLTEGQTYRVRAYATSEYGTAYSSELSFVAGTAEAQSFPADAITRVTNLIHRYNRKEGIYTLELALGEVTSDFGLPEWLSRPQASTPEKAAQQQQEDTAKSPAVKESIKAAIEEVITPEVIAPQPVAPQPVELTEYAKRILEEPAAKAFEARRKGLEIGVEAVVTPYAIDVLRQRKQEAGLLTEIRKITTAASATGITSYARQVLIKKAISLKQELRTIQEGR